MWAKVIDGGHFHRPFSKCFATGLFPQVHWKAQLAGLQLVTTCSGEEILILHFRPASCTESLLPKSSTVQHQGKDE